MQCAAEGLEAKQRSGRASTITISVRKNTVVSLRLFISLDYRAQILNAAWHRWVVGGTAKRMQVSVVEATVHVWHTSSVGEKEFANGGQRGWKCCSKLGPPTE